MRTLCKLFLLSSFLFLASCGGDEINNGLNFKLTYEGEPLVMFTDLTYPNGKTMQFQRISFYLSEINLAKDGTTVLSKEAEYIDLSTSHSTLEKANEGFDFVFDAEESLDYNEISFNIGLTEEMNASVPEDFLSSNPLSLAQEYWRDWGTYISIKIEGNLDKNEDGEYGAGESFALHLGTDIVTRKFSQTADGESFVKIGIEVDKIFNNAGQIYDLENFARLHTLSDENLAKMSELATNLESSFYVD